MNYSLRYGDDVTLGYSHFTTENKEAIASLYAVTVELLEYDKDTTTNVHLVTREDYTKAWKVIKSRFESKKFTTNEDF